LKLKEDTRLSHKCLTPKIEPRLSRNGNLTVYPLHHKSPDYIRMPKQPKERIGDFKFYPKSGKALGTISKCPKCGLKGQLALVFKYDSCRDERKRSTFKIYLRNLDKTRFIITHVTSNRVNGVHKYLGSCSLNFSYLKELDGLLLHGRHIPLTVKRIFARDIYGRGFNAKGVKIWSEKAEC
jgi:hypothetical protein